MIYILQPMKSETSSENDPKPFFVIVKSIPYFLRWWRINEDVFEIEYQSVFVLFTSTIIGTCDADCPKTCDISDSETIMLVTWPVTLHAAYIIKLFFQ